VNHHRRSAEVWHVFSRDFIVLPAHPHVHPQSEWAIPAFAFPAITGTRLPTPVCAGRLRWKGSVEKVSSELAMKYWMCDGCWKWWESGRWITIKCDIIGTVINTKLTKCGRKLIPKMRLCISKWVTAGFLEKDTFFSNLNCRQHENKIVVSSTPRVKRHLIFLPTTSANVP